MFVLSLLEKQHLDKTTTGLMYVPDYMQCHTDGLDVYRSHQDYFVESLRRV